MALAKTVGLLIAVLCCARTAGWLAGGEVSHAEERAAEISDSGDAVASDNESLADMFQPGLPEADLRDGVEPTHAELDDEPEAGVEDNDVQRFMAGLAKRSQPAAGGTDAARPPAFDPALVAAGRESFEGYCTQCHDAARALQKTKNLAGWRSTIQRMAAKPGAEIPVGELESIAVYLASLNPAAQGAGAAGGGTSESAASPASFYATFSPLWRDANPTDNVENRGFFPGLWFGAEWHPAESPLGGRATACISCHRGGEPGSRIELVEGVIRLDMAKWLEWRAEGPQAAVEMGRFIVPFGAFSAQSHPGAFRTVTPPLMFDMGQNVRRNDIGPPVLPMPYADEGAVAQLAVPVFCEATATLDTYVVNGLQGNLNGLNYLASREYTDNNAEPAVGARATIGNQYVRLGGSLMIGKFNDDVSAPPLDGVLNNELWGADLTLRYEDLIRVQFEYALRNSDRFVLLPDKLRDDEELDGVSLEGELRVWKKPRVGLLVRYDTLDRRGDRPPPGSSFGPTFGVHRLTWGFTIAAPGGSLLLINHEHWEFRAVNDCVDLLGLRWVATF